jgi:dTDP-4-dehydrorhamnose 3,5-epimerase
MKVTPLALPDILLIEPRVFADDRGWFTETFNARTFAVATGLDVAFVQDNHSCSKQGTLRGLHYQLPPHAQGKLVRVVAGAVLDVAVDIRRSSPTFGNWVAEELSAESMKQIFIPIGFAHAFLALTDGAEVVYKTTDFYDKASERSIRWDDPDLAIGWPQGLEPILASKDASAPAFADADTFG